MSVFSASTNEAPSQTRWRVNLPVFPPDAVLDNSTRSEYAACFRLGFYRYGLRRGFEGTNIPIQMGLAYHKYRETVEDHMMARGVGMNDEIHAIGMEAALKGWVDPEPDDDKNGHLNQVRLIATIQKARMRIELEQRTGSIKVTRSEDSFDLELPYVVCTSCGWSDFTPDGFNDDHPDNYTCRMCGVTGSVIRARHGGRVDQFTEFRNGMYIRDFKNTKWKNKWYEEKFDPNSQIQGYVWAGTQLSGRRFNGALIETVHHLKNSVDISQHYVDFSTGQQQQWLANQMMYDQFIRTAWARIDELGYLAFPQNTATCFRFNKPCRFLHACRMGSGREIENWLENYTIHSHWDFTNPDDEEGI